MTPMQMKKTVAGYESLPVFWTPVTDGTFSVPVLAATALNPDRDIVGEDATMCSIMARNIDEKYAISFTAFYHCCEQAKRLPMFVRLENGEHAPVREVNIEKDNGWIELVA